MASQALYFDGNDDFVQVTPTDSLNLREQLTVEAWVKGEFARGTLHTVARKGGVYYLGISDLRLYGRIMTTQWKVIWGIPPLDSGRWYHVAMTYHKDSGGRQANDLEQFDGLKMAPNDYVVRAGSANEFDQYIREIGNILYEPDEADPAKRYKLFYSGYQGQYMQNNVYVGYAYSEDGIRWIKHGRVLDRPLEDPYVIKKDNVYYLFAEDKADIPFRNIRRFNSADCVNWNDDGDVFDIQLGGTPPGWESEDVSSPVVWTEANMWYMLYEGRGAGYGGKVGLATSADGITWRRYENNPVFDAGQPGEWDETNVVCDDILKHNGRYYLIYHGYGASQSTGFWVGMAHSDDLVKWKRYKSNPFATFCTAMFMYDGQYTIFCETSGGIYRSYPYIVSAPQLYVDGIEQPCFVRDDCNNKPIAQDSYPLAIGKAPAGQSYCYKGQIDEVRIWDRALSHCEIRGHMYDQLSGEEPNLVGYWTFDQDEEQAVYDLSTFANHGHMGSDPNSPDICDPTRLVCVSTDRCEFRPCDLDNNMVVDAGDLRILTEQWLAVYDALSDLNCDGIVNFADFALLASEWSGNER